MTTDNFHGIDRLVHAGALAIKSALTSFREFSNILCLLTGPEFSAFKEIFLTLSAVSTDPTLPRLKANEQTENAIRIRAVEKILSDCRGAFGSSTGATGLPPAANRPYSPHTLIVLEIAELWEELTDRQIVNPSSAAEEDYDSDRRVRSVQGQTQFIFEVIKMIDVKITLRETETAIRHVHQTGGDFFPLSLALAIHAA
jgi:hypothetical protein